MTTNRLFLAGPAVAAVLALTLTACGDDADDADDRETSSPRADALGETTTDPRTDTDTEAVDSALAAVSAAEAEVDGTAYEVSEEDGGWEVDVAVGERSHEVRVGSDGTVVHAQDDDRLDAEDADGLTAANLSVAEAIRVAAETGPGGRFDDVSLERQRGGHVWEVSFDDGPTEREVHVDVASGEVLRTTVDD